jgi:hypothetical protein
MSEIQKEIEALRAENEKLKKARHFPSIAAAIMSQPDGESTLRQRIVQQGLMTPEANKPVSNYIPVCKEDYDLILSKFPEIYHLKLRVYTGEELYYLYRICIFKPKLDKDGQLSNSSDSFILSQKARCFKWLRGELKSGLNSAVLNSIGRKFREGFYTMVIDTMTKEMIDSFGKNMNSRRVLGG